MYFQVFCGFLLLFFYFFLQIAHRTLVVGHSLGAECTGEAGKFTKKRGVIINECTGLDPSGAGFDGGSPEIRLTKDDCRVVQIIHSSGEFVAWNLGVIPLRLGTPYKSGNCDFWVNCGHTQGIHCTDPRFGDFIRREITGDLIQQPLCEHYRSTQVYLSAVRGACNFRSFFCTNCGTETNFINYHNNVCDYDPSLGINSLPPNSVCSGDQNVNYFLSTTDRYPYC